MPLMRAVIEGSLEEVKLLIDMGQDVNYADYYTGRTVIGEAIRSGNLEIVHYLVEHGANVNEVRDQVEKPLIVAASCNNLEIVKYLINCGAYVNYEDENGDIAFMHAVKNGNMDIIKYLVKQGAYVGHTNNDGQSALSYAISKDNLGLVKYLVNNLVKIDSTYNNDMIANTLGNNRWFLEAVEYLMGRGVNLNFKIIPKSTLLKYAEKKDNEKIMRYLLKGTKIGFSRLEKDKKKIYDIVTTFLEDNSVLHQMVIKNIKKIDVISTRKGGYKVIFRDADGKLGLRYVKKAGEDRFVEKKKKSRYKIIILLKKPRKLIKKLYRYFMMESMEYEKLGVSYSNLKRQAPRSMDGPSI